MKIIYMILAFAACCFLLLQRMEWNYIANHDKRISELGKFVDKQVAEYEAKKPRYCLAKNEICNNQKIKYLFTQN